MRHITISETLRPWSLLGITHFLPEEPVFDEQPPVGTPDEYSCSVDNDLSLSRSNYNPSALSSSPVGGTSLGLPVPSLHLTSRQSEKDFSPSLNDNCLTSEYGNNDFSLDNFSLNREWKMQLDKTPKSPVVWSYRELGLDLAGKSLPQRSACLRTIISRLSLPKGSNAFWPFSLLSQERVLQNDIKSYLFGLEYLSPKVVVLFEDKSLEPLFRFFQLRLPFTQQVFKGKLYILLPDFPSLLESNSLRENACSYLKSALSIISPR